jgi:ECF transporter S component (folate family)
MKKTKTIVFLGLLIALNVVLTEVAKLLPFASIVRISLSFIPIAAGAMMYGPIPAGVAAALADIISFFIFPDGAYFPGFTASAFIAGLLFGMALYKKQPSVIRTFAASFFVILFVDVSLNTIWLYILMPGNTLWALFLPRLIKSLLMIPFETFIIFALWPVLERLRIKSST